MKKCKETELRLSILEELVTNLKSVSKGIILTGSLAYAPFEHVNTDSDIDLILIAENLKRTGSLFINNPDHKEAIKKRFFDGYCIKDEYKGVSISYHILSLDAFDIITKCFVADIRVFRQKPKSGTYQLRNFKGKEYPYKITNKKLEDFGEEGYRTIVPISFIKYDKYYNGVYRDKLLCSPSIIYDTNHFVEKGLEKLWQNVVMNLRDESLRTNESIDLDKLNILNTLAKKEKLNQEKRDIIHSKTKTILDYLSH
jgi:hypothetical protein